MIPSLLAPRQRVMEPPVRWRLLLLLGGMLIGPQPVRALSVSGYMPWWESDDHATAYFSSGAFDAQMRMLDEVTYFGEFQFDASGGIHFNGTNIASADAGHWYIVQMQSTLNRIREANPSARITFTIGGAGNSEHFEEVARSGTARSKAANQVAAIINRFEFDGLDLNWEGHNIPPHDATVANHYGLLTQAIDGVLTDPQRLSATLQYNRYLAASAVVPHVDLVRVMTYDAPEVDSGPHWPLAATDNHTSLSGTTYIIDQVIAENIDPAQLGIGVAFYGLDLGAWSGSVDFSSLDQRYFDTHAAWLPDHLTSWDGKGFDSIDSIRGKIDLATDRGLQELFTWELSQDSYRAGRWLPLTTALTRIPEPASLGLLAPPGAVLLCRRDRSLN